MILLTSSVDAGLSTAKGTSPGEDGCEDHDELEWLSSSLCSVDMFSAPIMSRKSVHAACRFVGAVLCSGACVAARGAVELVSGFGGLRVPAQ
jgi:hypothetical protein